MGGNLVACAAAPAALEPVDLGERPGTAVSRNAMLLAIKPAAPLVCGRLNHRLAAGTMGRRCHRARLSSAAACALAGLDQRHPARRFACGRRE